MSEFYENTLFPERNAFSEWSILQERYKKCEEIYKKSLRRSKPKIFEARKSLPNHFAEIKKKLEALKVNMNGDRLTDEALTVFWATAGLWVEDLPDAWETFFVGLYSETQRLSDEEIKCICSVRDIILAQWASFSNSVEGDLHDFGKKLFKSLRAHSDFVPKFIRLFFCFDEDPEDSLFIKMDDAQGESINKIKETLEILKKVCAALSILNELDTVDMYLIGHPEFDIDTTTDDWETCFKELSEASKKECRAFWKKKENVEIAICNFVAQNDLTAEQSNVLFEVAEQWFQRDYEDGTFSAYDFEHIFLALPMTIRNELFGE